MLDLSGNKSLDAGDAEIIAQLLGEGGGGQQSLNQIMYLPRVARYSYDYRNHMVKAVYTDDTEQTFVHRYAYDCPPRRIFDFGRRVRKVTGMTPDPNSPGGGSATEWTTDGVPGTGLETRFINGGPGTWQVLEEQDAAGATAATFVYGAYIDDILNMVRDPDGTGPLTPQSVYYHTDDLSNVVALTSGPGGVRMPPPWGQGETLGPGYVIERLYYGDFGKPGWVGGVPGSPVGNTRKWNGRDWDAEVELYYYRTRYLEPAWGRFTTRDSIGIWGDPANHGNGLSYVGSAPWTYTDSSGRGRTRLFGADIVFFNANMNIGFSPGDLTGGWFPIKIGPNFEASVGIEVVANCRSGDIGFAVTFGGAIGFGGSIGNGQPVDADLALTLGVAWNVPNLAAWSGPGWEIGWQHSLKPHAGGGWSREWAAFGSLTPPFQFGLAKSWGVSNGISANVYFGLTYTLGLPGTWKSMHAGIYSVLCTDGLSLNPCQASGGGGGSASDAEEAIRALKSWTISQRAQVEEELLWSADQPGDLYLYAFVSEVLEAIGNR